MGVRLIGTNVDAIDKAEDRELFKEAMQAIGQPHHPLGHRLRRGDGAP